MIFAVFAPAMATAPTVAGVPVFLWEMILDLIGLTAAIWSCWVLAWLDVEGALRGAFRYLTIGGVIFAILHLQDSLLRLGQALSSDWINLIHIGSMLLVMIFLVLGLARLADAALQEQPSATGIPPTRWWPLALSTALVLGALSFITYGLSLASAMLALFALHGSLVLLTVICVVQVLRARLGGSVGRALGWGLLAVLIFSLVHPAQYLLSLANILGPTPYFALLHRIFVIPAFVLFCVSLSSLSRAWGTRQPEDASEALKAGRRKLEIF